MLKRLSLLVAALAAFALPAQADEVFGKSIKIDGSFETQYCFPGRPCNPKTESREATHMYVSEDGKNIFIYAGKNKGELQPNGKWVDYGKRGKVRVTARGNQVTVDGSLDPITLKRDIRVSGKTCKSGLQYFARGAKSSTRYLKVTCSVTKGNRFQK